MLPESDSLRNTPVQERSQLRLAELLAAASDVLSEVGRDRLTTAMVAERAGASIGTIYRYFPDRTLILDLIEPMHPHGIAAVNALHEPLQVDENGIYMCVYCCTTDGNGIDRTQECQTAHVHHFDVDTRCATIRALVGGHDALTETDPR